MRDYVRPELPDVVIRDADGKPIDYGNRWGPDGPPGDSYEHTSNLARFEPIVTVAKSLIDWLEATFDVDVDERPAGGGWQVTIAPPPGDAVPLVVTFTGFPGVTVEVGGDEPVSFPVCGCDACDDDIEAELDRLETLVCAVVNGDRNGAAWPSADGPTQGVM